MLRYYNISLVYQKFWMIVVEQQTELMWSMRYCDEVPYYDLLLVNIRRPCSHGTQIFNAKELSDIKLVLGL